MTRIHLLCGLVGAGKTTYARSLAAELPAVRFSRDEWMLRLYGLSFDDPGYAVRIGACTEVIWESARTVSRLGHEVVLDWNQWSRTRRATWRERAGTLGIPVRLHHLDVPIETAIRRARRRSDPGSHRLTEADVRHFAGIFEPPTADEGLDTIVVRHAAAPTQPTRPTRPPVVG